jgi:uncharacterized protein (TIGR02118 family)
MAQLLIMYKQPADPAAFEEYYFSTHMPILQTRRGFVQPRLAKVLLLPSRVMPPTT